MVPEFFSPVMSELRVSANLSALRASALSFPAARTHRSASSALLRAPKFSFSCKGIVSVVREALVVRENNAPGRIHILADGPGIKRERRKSPRTWPVIRILHFLYVVARLSIAGNSVRLIDGALSRIVGREGQVEITIIPLQQRLQICNTGLDVLLRRVKVACAKTLRGGRHQLHQSDRALAGNRGGIPVTLGLNHRSNQRRINVVPVSGFVHDALDAVAIDADCRAIIASREGRLARHVDRVALPRRRNPCRDNGFGVHPEVPTGLVRYLGDLRVRGARAHQSRCGEKGSGNDRNGGKTSAKRSKAALALDRRWPGKAHL